MTSFSRTPENHLVAYSDGGARGNPGPAGFGVVIKDASGRKLSTISEYLGHQTNNFAEYQGLIAALEYAVANGHKALKAVSDSELLVKQIKGIYKVKNAALQDLNVRARELIAQLDWFLIEHVLRGQNQEADRLANAAMDRGMGRSTATLTKTSSVPLPPLATEFDGVVRNGKIELKNGTLPDGTLVQVRVKG